MSDAVREFRFLADEQSVRRQLRLTDGDKIKQKVYDEYEYRIRMRHGDGLVGPLGSDNIMNMLRFLDEKPKTMYDPPDNAPTDWMTVPEGTRVIVKDPDHGNRPMKGVFRNNRNGLLSIMIPELEPQLQIIFAKFVKIDNGRLDPLPKSPNKESADWDDVLLGTPVITVLENGKEVEGALAEHGPGPERLTILVSGETVYCERKKTKIITEAVV